jgi:hypothetical protein
LGEQTGLLLALSLLIGCRGAHEGPGTVSPSEVPRQIVEARSDRQTFAHKELRQKSSGDIGSPKQILFGDLHAHTTFSADAFAISLPIMGGDGARPPADACDFARFCADLDFWSINDHAENLTPRHWRETKESIRDCNAVAGDPEDPDLVAFLGWEWSQVGGSPESHYGHKNVILLDTAEESVPKRPISAWRPEFKGAGVPLMARILLPLRDFAKRERYFQHQTYEKEIRETPYCAEGVDTHELPEDCLEFARTPRELFRKLDEWGFDTIVIPHGTSWGLMVPPGATLDTQLSSTQHDPVKQILFEIYSGHGSAEEYRGWRTAARDLDGNQICPEPSDGYLPCCWRAGEIIRARCEDPTSDLCERRVVAARKNFVDAGVAGYRTVPGARVADWLDCGQCDDCFAPAFDHRPRNTAQYALSIANLTDARGAQRFRFGFIGSSDNHRAQPGAGYKEFARRRMTEVGTPPSGLWGSTPKPASESVPVVLAELPIAQRRYMERQASFFLTGGLVAAHSRGRNREAIWSALKQREVYATSGERILLWFDLLNGSTGSAPMGSEVTMKVNPRFRVAAVGALKQLPGCSDHVASALGADRLRTLCLGECYHPSDERRLVTRIEVIRIRPPQFPGEAPEDLIEDLWRRFDCLPDPAGCAVEFEDPEFLKMGRDVTYYVRAIQEPTLAVNAGFLRCEYDEAGRCVKVDPCYGDDRTDFDDDCLGEIEERAWSSPIFVSQPSTRRVTQDPPGRQ